MQAMDCCIYERGKLDMKITINDVEYEANAEDETQANIIAVLNKGSQSLALLDHMLQCVNAIQQMKTVELENLLKESEDVQTAVTN
jgi:chloramphenicol O-acetyltransferase